MMSSHKPFYDVIAEDYTASKFSYANRRFYEFTFQHLLNHAPVDLKQARILDCMCGAAELVEFVGDQVGSVHATDISFQMLQRANPEALPDSLVCADAVRLPYATGSFDAIFIRGGLHHVPEIYTDVLSELWRVLKPGGWLVCNEPWDDNPVIFLIREFMHRVSDVFEEGERGFHIKALTDAFEAKRFRNVGWIPHGYVAYTLIGNTNVLPFFINLRRDWLINGMIALDAMLPHVPLLRRFALSILVRAQKPAE